MTRSCSIHECAGERHTRRLIMYEYIRFTPAFDCNAFLETHHGRAYASMIPASTQQFPTTYIRPLSHRPKKTFWPRNSSLYASASQMPCVPIQTTPEMRARRGDMCSRGIRSGRNRVYHKKYCIVFCKCAVTIRNYGGNLPVRCRPY